MPNVGTNVLDQTASVWQGAHAADWTSAFQSVACGNSTCWNPFQFATGDFTVGLATRTPSGGIGCATAYLMGTENCCGPSGNGWALGLTGASHKALFQLNGSDSLNSDSTYTDDTWFSLAGRFTNASKLMEAFLNGALQATTLTAAAVPTANATFQLFGTCDKYTDEYWVFGGAMATADVLRVHVCGIDGAQCQCDWGGDPTAYTSRPRYTTGTMPACNAGGPS